MNHEKIDTYQLVWSDDFQQEGAVDPEKWSFDTGHGHNGWGNAEAQYYTDNLENCRVQEGCLRIRATYNSSSDRIYSARIHSYGKASWTYGRFEIKARIPAGTGTWPAIWMLSEDIRRGTSWPLCGEIDIMEHVGRMPGQIHFSLHSQKYNHINKTQVTGGYPQPHASDAFHMYRMDWNPEGFYYYIDDQLQGSFLKGEKSGEEEWPYDKPYFLILNLAMGGYWGGEIDPSCLPAEMLVDYVRVYQKENS